MKKTLRIFSIMCMAVLLLCACALTASAENAVYYYIHSEAGTDDIAGDSPNAPLRTYTDACLNAIKSGADKAYIVIMNEYVFSGNVTEQAHPDVEFVLTTNDGVTDYGSLGAKLVFKGARRYYLNGDTTFENMEIVRDNSLVVIGQYNHITFGEGLTMTFTAESEAGLWVVGGYQAPEDNVDVTKDSHITIKSGTFHRVIGGSRQKWTDAQGMVYTGTHHLEVSGGTIDMMFGSSYANQAGDSAVITVSGGELNRLYVAGDATRRLENDANVTLSGGKIGEVFVNNTLGEANVTISGTEIGTMAVSYANDSLAEKARLKNKDKTLYYDAHYYTEDQIEAFGTTFDGTVNITKVYAKAGAKGSGKTESDPASFESAFATAIAEKAELAVIGSITLTDFTEPAHTAAVTVTGADDKATLTVKGGYTLGGETIFTDIKLAGDGTWNAENGMLHIAADMTVSTKCNIVGSAILKSGSFGSITNAGTVLVDGAKVDSVTGGGSAANVEIVSGSVGSITSTDSTIADFALTVNGGEIGSVHFVNVTKSIRCKLFGGSVGAYTAANNIAKGTLQLADGISTDTLGAAASLFNIDTHRVYFLANGGTGNGSSASNPGGSLMDAYTAIGNNDGTIVICGEFTGMATFNAPVHSGKVLLTSVYDGVDYRKNGAKLIINQSFYIGGDTTFDAIEIISIKSYVGFMANYKTLTIGEDVTTGYAGTNETYPCIIAGNRSNTESGKAVVNVGSGTWQRVRVGNSANSPKNVEIEMNWNGGKVIEMVYLSSATTHNGDVTFTMNGGELGYGIVGIAYDRDDQVYTGNMTLNFNGGNVYGRIRPRYKNTGILNGTWTVNVAGGDFGHCAELVGTVGLSDTMTSTLNISGGFDFNAEMTGTYTFTNPIRYWGADPWILYHDGAYYYTATGGNTLMLYKAANIGDLSNAYGTTIYDPEDGLDWSCNMWSPEIHYFSAEQVGEEHAGWYCFVTSDDGKDWNYSKLRGYVIKCLDGDNLMGRWGNPITGEVNVPELIVFRDAADKDKYKWMGGMSTLEVNGENYIIFVNEYNRDTVDFYQALQIAKYENPWTIIGEPTEICAPTYEWEKIGGGDGVHPYTVECITGVYGDDGSVYLSYAGSTYWSSTYAVGCMKYLGGDPMDAKSWEKSPEPIFSKSAEVNGCAHACYVTDTDGNDWAMYHAYITGDANTGRYAMIEPYSASKDGLVIGNGTKHPAPLSTAYTANVNPTPLSGKAIQFHTVNDNGTKFALTREYDGRFADVTENHWFYSFVKNAYRMSLANGTSETKFSPNDPFTVAQVLTVAVNIHKAYYGKTVRAAVAGEKWYDPYVEYCVQNGIITKGQFANMDANITRGDMAIVFANILPDSEYTATRDGAPADVQSDSACYSAVSKLFKAGIVSGDAGTGNYRPNDSIKRSEACVIFTRIAMASERIK